jgi:hypothetical protein
MGDLVKPLIGAAAAVLLVAAAMILSPTLASAQDIGGMIGGAMRGFGVAPGYGYRAPARRSAPSASHKEKDADDEDDGDSSSKSAKSSDKNSDKNSSDKNSSDKGSSDKSASADNKPRRQLSNAKDDTPTPAVTTPTAKAEPPKSTADDEPSFSPSR